MKDRELWMDKLKERFENYSEPVPDSGWAQLEKEFMPPVEKKMYPYSKWIFAAAAVILLALVSSVSLYFLGSPAADEMRHLSTPAIASAPDVLPGVQHPDVKGAKIDFGIRQTSNAKYQKLAKAEQKILQVESLSEKEYEDKTDADLRVVEKVEGKEMLKTEDKQDKTDTEQTQKQPRRASAKDKLHIPVEKTQAKKNNWSMGLAVGNSGGTSAQLGGGSYMSRVNMAAAVSNGMMQDIPSDQTLIFADGIPYLRAAKEIVDIEHHQPVSVGVSVRKSLGRGFSLETGLTYTLLSSDVKLVDKDYSVDQKLHYLGIPLRANWNFLDKKLFTLYVSGGGMVEKCVYGKLGSEKETVKPLQFSVSGGVGAQVNATKHIGFYVEPGVAYFFDDGSSVQTIRKENPFNFNIQAGIRFTY